MSQGGENITELSNFDCKNNKINFHMKLSEICEQGKFILLAILSVRKVVFSTIVLLLPMVEGDTLNLRYFYSQEYFRPDSNTPLDFFLRKHILDDNLKCWSLRKLDPY